VSVGTLPENLPSNLTPLGFSPELAEVITPDEFCQETERAWKSVLQELKGEKPANNGGALHLKVLARPAEAAALPPSPNPIGEGLPATSASLRLDGWSTTGCARSSA
jgi:hypothetical protein